MSEKLNKIPDENVKKYAKIIRSAPGKVYLGVEFHGVLPLPFVGMAVSQQDKQKLEKFIKQVSAGNIPDRDSLRKYISAASAAVLSPFSIPVTPSNNFTWKELDPTGDLRASEDPEKIKNILDLAKTLEKIREEFGNPIGVTKRGGYHGPTTDKQGRVKRKQTSQHRLGKAADIYPIPNTPNQRSRLMQTILGMYEGDEIHVGWLKNYKSGFIHFDIGPKRGKWEREG